MSEGIFILLIFAVSGLVYIQFLRGRRRNLTLMKNFIRFAEELFRPIDKTYTWLGGVAGFKAVYELPGDIALELTYILLPRQSLLYFPISKFLMKSDRIFVVYHLPTKLGVGEFHLVQAGKEGYGKIKKSLLKQKVILEGCEFDLYLEREECCEKVASTIERIRQVERIRHIAYLDRERKFYAAIWDNGTHSRELIKSLHKIAVGSR